MLGVGSADGVVDDAPVNGEDVVDQHRAASDVASPIDGGASGLAVDAVASVRGHGSREATALRRVQVTMGRLARLYEVLGVQLAAVVEIEFELDREAES
jgi:hypothetical protein